jgi:expansin (peptidoglycan-binding protein)
VRTRLAALAPLLIVLACGSDDEGDGAGVVADAGLAPPPGSSLDGGGSDGAPASPRDAAADGATRDAADAAPAVSYTGEATYYDADGTGACGFSATPGDLLVAAMNKAQYQKSLCGQCVHVNGPKGEVTVRIVDLCPGCKSGDLDLSEQAFEAISPLSAGRVKIAWSFVPCP